MKDRLALLLLTLAATSLLAPALITNAHAAGCSSPCNFETDANVPTSDATVTVRLDGATLYTLNHTFQFANNTRHTIEVMNTIINVPSTGARYVFKQWLLSGGPWDPMPLTTTPFILTNYTSTQNGPLIAQFEKQFQLTMTFTDPSGTALNPPTSVTLQGPSTITLTTYSAQYLPASVWTVTDATWEGASQIVFGSPTIDLTNGPVTTTIPLSAYPATIHIVDSQNNPIPGVDVAVTFVNATLRTFTSDSQGQIQLGHIPSVGGQATFSAHIVYKGQDNTYTIDASQTPTATITLNAGSGPTSGPVVSALVLVTIFGIAIFLLVLALKVRKPPPPPAI